MRALVDPVVPWVGVPVGDVLPKLQRSVPGHHLLHYEHALLLLEQWLHGVRFRQQR